MAGSGKRQRTCNAANLVDPLRSLAPNPLPISSSPRPVIRDGGGSEESSRRPARFRVCQRHQEFVMRIRHALVALSLAAAPVALLVSPANALSPGQTVCY